jgi:hypothetical protein
MSAPSGPAPEDQDQRQRGGLLSRLSRWAAPQEEVHAEQEQQAAAKLGGTPVARLPLRRRATVCGTLRSVTLRPRAGVPALVAELYDGTGTVGLIWLGRRQIAGIEPGRRMRVYGRVTESEGRKVLFNPRYELMPPAGG